MTGPPSVAVYVEEALVTLLLQQIQLWHERTALVVYKQTSYHYPEYQSLIGLILAVKECAIFPCSGGDDTACSTTYDQNLTNVTS